MSGKKARLAECFTEAYYETVSSDDIGGVTPDDLFGAALSLWNFAARRAPGEAKIRVYNPELSEHGWTSRHTIVEIVNDDMPFLVDSVTAALNTCGLTVHLVVHPVLRVRRDAAGRMVDILDDKAEEDRVLRESSMHVEIDQLTSRQAQQELSHQLSEVLTDVRAAVADWRAILGRVSAIIDELRTDASPAPEEEKDEVRAFLEWLHDDQFTFLGYREYDLVHEKGKDFLRVVPDTGLGILRRILPEAKAHEHKALSEVVSRFARRNELLIVTKANRRSTVHRAVQMDYIGIRRFDASGKVIGEHRFLGLFTSTAYSASPLEIPVLRRKVKGALEHAGFPPASHDGKALLHILETYPRDELFQISDDDLFEIGLGILHLQERQRIALFVRRDVFERYVSCLVYVPNDRYDRELRTKIQAILERAFEGETTFYTTEFGEIVLARVHFILRTTPGCIPDLDIHEIERQIVEVARSWADELREALIDEAGEEEGLRLFRSYEGAFPSSYREHFNPQTAIRDIGKIEVVRETGKVGMNLYRPVEAPEEVLRFKIYHAGEPLPLSEAIPVLENMGLNVIDEIPHRVAPEGAEVAVYIHDFGMVSRRDEPVPLSEVREKFEGVFGRVLSGEVEDDGLNHLVILSCLSWREILILRAYSRFLRQAGTAFSLAYMEETFAHNPKVARLLVDLFEVRLSPRVGGKRAVRTLEISVAIDEVLETVPSLDEDRILRRFHDFIRNTLRTNYYQTDSEGNPKPYLALKLDSQAVDDLPLPRPLVEVFVYSPRVEAVHLRGGKVARGGIRWSDRREDFRTEVLALMKAQTVKNAVIVPVGAKGGFVVKRPPLTGDREAQVAEGIECYRIMMRGLLDLTDNIRGGKVVAPPDLVRHDADDPYLVVAADKGTASFSDIANDIAASYGFWLGDAFASGGTQGYDHKKMGITARGAWESVKRHFHELGQDIQSEDFSVIGVGDMSGDVFGNGMLLSRHIRLLGAFNHRHIFVDPDPDAEVSFKERKRLFAVPGSSWSDYDPKRISAGGGVFERRAKSIDVTPEMKARFHLRQKKTTPDELVRALLRAKVDLLWFGGIGTFVKARDEGHAEAGDRANDGVRVNARDLAARVIGEGANLGITQRGRIEFALKGGRINTDAVDNSGGVDCSDHEVNIKILLDDVVDRGDMTEKQRNRLLGRMEEEVAALVLRDNYLQTLALSIAESWGIDRLGARVRFMRRLEHRGRLNRALEFLPDSEALEKRAAEKQGLTRPEIAVLLAYAKLELCEELLCSEFLDDSSLSGDLACYFPTPLRKKYEKAIARHRLHREIAATCLTNAVVNTAGPTFVTEMEEKMGASAPQIVRSFVITRRIFDLDSLWKAIEDLDNRVEATAQHDMFRAILRVYERTSVWLLRGGKMPIDSPEAVAAYRQNLDEFAASLEDLLAPSDLTVVAQRTDNFIAQGAPEDLARRVASLEALSLALDAVRIACEHGYSVTAVGRTFFALGARVGIDELRVAAHTIVPETDWQRQAVATLLDELLALQSDLAMKIFHISGGTAVADEVIDDWLAARRRPVERVNRILSDIRAAGAIDLAMLTIVAAELRRMIEG
jgi:glutamate dehydrogenase